MLYFPSVAEFDSSPIMQQYSKERRFVLLLLKEFDSETKKNLGMISFNGINHSSQ